MPRNPATTVEIRWSDIDGFGHVSHIALVAIAEHGRSRWLDSVLGVAPATWPYVIAYLELEFRAPVGFTDREVRCLIEPITIGNSSVRLRERFNSPDGTLIMELTSVIVAWDEERSAKRALSEHESARLAEFIGRDPLPGR